MAKYTDELMDHEYDGIHEQDNFLPRWWLYLFYFTIAFAVVYMLYYHVFQTGYSQLDQYRQEVDPTYVRHAEADARILGVLPEYHAPLSRQPADRTPKQIAMAGPQKLRVFMTRDTDTTIYEAAVDPAALSGGERTFKTICSQCHGRLGEGGVGPNLTDDYWLHGATITDVVKSVKYGYPAKGMLPWLGQLQEDEIINVSSYLQTLRGTNPPNARPPQGDLVEY